MFSMPEHHVEEEAPGEGEVLSMAKFVKKLWHHPVSPEDLQIFREQIKSPLSRKDFVMCLQQPRMLGTSEISSELERSVAEVVMIVLDQCLVDKDSYIAKQIMVLMFTYYSVKKDGETSKKEYLYNLLKESSIWGCMEFWESALIESLYENSKGSHEAVTTLSTRVSR